MLSAIAFLSLNDVTQGFEELADYLRNAYNGDADDLLDYFDDTYIGWYRKNVPRRQPNKQQHTVLSKVTYYRVILNSGNSLRRCKKETARSVLLLPK